MPLLFKELVILKFNGKVIFAWQGKSCKIADSSLKIRLSVIEQFGFYGNTICLESSSAPSKPFRTLSQKVACDYILEVNQE